MRGFAPASGGAFAAGDVPVQMDRGATASAFVQIIHILRDEHSLRLAALNLRQRMMAGVGLCAAYSGAAKSIP
jgi:hypothetical protein